MSGHATPQDARVMAAILKDAGVSEYEPRVISQLLEFAYKYTSDVLEDARVFSEHAGKRSGIDSDDVKMSINNQVESKFTTPPPKQLIADLAKDKNSQPLPAIKQQYGLHLPPDRYSLLQPNYRLKRDTINNHSTTPQQSHTPNYSQQQSPAMNLGMGNPQMVKRIKLDDDYDI